MDALKEKIRAEALSLGFSFIGFSQPVQTPHFPQFVAWIAEGKHNGLDYLGKKYVLDARFQPAILLQSAASVITFGMAYPVPIVKTDSKNSDSKKYGNLAAYACLPDYHRFIKDKIRELIARINNSRNPSAKFKIFIDSGPVMEKDFAFMSGLGWIGRNSLFISPFFGSYILLACLFTDFELQPDMPDETDLCGNCEACLQACPTRAIGNNRTIDANRCISYLTTCYKGVVPFELQRMIGSSVFGCDICQTVCPLNHLIPNKRLFQDYPMMPFINNKVDLYAELSISENAYLKKYTRTPVGKLPYEIYLRNLIIAAGNSDEMDFFDILAGFLINHASSVIRITASSALKILAAERSEPVISCALKQESSVEVRQAIGKLPGTLR